MAVKGFRPVTSAALLRGMDETRQQCAAALLTVDAAIKQQAREREIVDARQAARVQTLQEQADDTLGMLNAFCSELTLGQRLRWLLTGRLPCILPTEIA